MTTAEVIEELRAAESKGVEIPIYGCDGHWWVWFRPGYGFAYDYECCDGCEGGANLVFKTVEQLAKQLESFNGEWEIV